ncbi:MAG: response regulator transcription factor [Planctomycetota bacterium]|nr:response regulator transcription factor [Planctomycetota bacterium]
MRPRVLLADDHTLLLGAFRKLLEPECEVVGAVENGRALLDSARELRPDVVVVDISMPLLNGLDAGRQLKQMLPGARLIFLTMDEDPDLVAEALRIGASGYLLKNSAASELVLAIREAMDGKTYVTPRAAERMGHARLGDGLTPRQREVLQLLAEGHSMKEAAGILNVTPRTVAFHKYRLMEELGLKTNADLVQYAVRHKIVSV